MTLSRRSLLQAAALAAASGLAQSRRRRMASATSASALDAGVGTTATKSMFLPSNRQALQVLSRTLPTAEVLP